MADRELRKPSGIARIVYKEIVSGDRRKFEARSHDSQTGGGARDLRFSPYATFLKVFEKMMPQKDTKGICMGQFNWIEKGKEQSCSAFFHPPTSARPNEGRIANVDKYLPKHGLPPEQDGTTILLFIQRDDMSVWPEFVTEQSLLSEGWHPAVKELILACLHAHRRADVSMCGFIDFVTGETYCNGK